jgi:hypothetical protein
MKKVIINNFRWYVDESTGVAYENENKTGASFQMNSKHLTTNERGQLNNQLRFNH